MFALSLLLYTHQLLQFGFLRIYSSLQIYNNRIIRYLEEPTDSLSLIRDEDRLVAYRLTKDKQHVPLVVFMHQRMEE